MLHGRMQMRSEQEADADLAHGARGFFGRHRDAHAQGFQHVRAAARSGEGPVAVLGHARAGSGHHHRRGGRDVERAGAVAAGAAGVDDIRAGVDHDHALAHGSGESGELGRGLAFHLQSDQKCRDHRLARLAFEQHAHGFDELLPRSDRGFDAEPRRCDEGRAGVTCGIVEILQLIAMKIHEYQAKALLARHGVPVPRGEVALTVDEAEAAAKAHRRQRGGESADPRGRPRQRRRRQGRQGRRGSSRRSREKMLGMTLVTHQTGPEGRVVQRMLIEETLPIERELYLGHRARSRTGKNVFMASADGGVEIEEVAAKTPERILKEPIEPGLGLTPFQARKLAFGIGITGAPANLAAQAMMALARANDALDASLAEINPFILTKDGKVYALDAKINLDDNALFRHKDLLDLRDLNEEDPLEVEASRFGLNYIKLDGTVACMVNGAGLAMATMDIIKYAGGSPANFLDVGGGANAEQIQNAFRILLSDKAVKAVLINIFGGILRCDTLATGVVAAARELSVKVPIVVRMEGTNVELGRKILMESGFNFTVADGMRDAAEKVVSWRQAK